MCVLCFTFLTTAMCLWRRFVCSICRVLRALQMGDSELRLCAITAELANLPIYNFYTLRALIEHLQLIAANVVSYHCNACI